LQISNPLEFKACCADLYSNKTLLLLLGPSLHPGGLDLTKKLADELGLSSEDMVLDVASGTGSTTWFLSKTYGCKVHGVDLSKSLVKQASITNRDNGACFVLCDGENLPFKDESFTTTVSECSLCLFPDLQQGLSEIRRTLQPEGKFGVTDFSVKGQLPPELDNVLTSLLCLSRKTSSEGYSDLVEQAGFNNVQVNDCSDSLKQLLEGVKKRLLIAQLLQGTGRLSLSYEQIAKAKRLLSLAEVSLNERRLGYLMLTAQKS
jgi:arsenite methyltransferase